MSVVRPLTVLRVTSTRLNFSVCELSTTSSCAAGSKWRLKQGLGRHGNEYGPLQEIPDWSYADGRPAPLWPREVKRRQKQKELAQHAVRLMTELKDAKKTFAQGDSVRPQHPFARTDIEHRITSTRFRVEKL